MKKDYYWILAIAMLALALRLYFAFQTPAFTGDEAYMTLRQVEHIRATGMPLTYDELSYGGRTHIFAPFFYYFLAFFNLFLPLDLVGKLIPNLFSILIIPIAYLLSWKLTRQRDAAIFGAAMAGFIPAFFSNLNSISAYSVVFPMLFYMIYCFIDIDEDNNAYIFMALFFVSTLFSSITFLLLISMVGYLVLAKLENFRMKKNELEVTMFSIFFFLWLQILVYKNAFLFHGAAIIWQNIPVQILADYFAGTNIVKVISLIGAIPLTYGVYSISHYLFDEKNKNAYILISMAFSAALLVWLKLITTEPGMLCLGITMAILFSRFYQFVFDELKITRLNRFYRPIWAAFIFIFIFSSVVPSAYYAGRAAENSLSIRDISAMQWIKINTPPDSVILSTPGEGNLITALAKRRNTADSDYLLIPNINKRFKDIKNIFTAYYSADAARLLNENGIDYIYFSDRARQEFKIKGLNFADDNTCFRPVYDFDGKVQIYEVLC